MEMYTGLPGSEHDFILPEFGQLSRHRCAVRQMDIRQKSLIALTVFRESVPAILGMLLYGYF